MKKILSAALLGLFSYGSHASEATLEKNLKHNYPDLPFQVINETPVKKIYSVKIGDSLVYTDEQARYFFVGNLVDFKTKENLTTKQEQKINKIDVSTLPLEQAIKHVKGNGERVLYVFSDPDCPYCKQLEQAMTSIDNVTIYLFLYPIVNIHPHADVIAQQIWCSSNPYEAWEDYMLHSKAPAASSQCKHPISANMQLGKTLKVAGTPTFFLQDGQRIVGGRDSSEIEALLQSVKSSTGTTR